VVSAFVGIISLTSHLVDGLSQPLDITRSDSGNRNAAVLGSVDRVLLGQSVHLLWLEASIGEHTDLREINMSGLR
jgi:hypothetical protein